MSFIILVNSCLRDRAAKRDRGARDTWIREWGQLIPHRFVLGAGNDNLARDEIEIRAPDDYGSMPLKVRLGCLWAVQNGYERVFVADMDTYICVPRLLHSDYYEHEYVGARCDEGHASGGSGFWLGPKALKIIATSHAGGPYSDLWVGHALHKAGINLHDDKRYTGAAPESWRNDTITVHLGRGTGNYDPEWMRECHRTYLEYAA